MATITVKLDKARAEKLERWARARHSTKSDVIRELIDNRGPIDTADDLLAWAREAQGIGLGLAQRKRRVRR